MANVVLPTHLVCLSLEKQQYENKKNAHSSRAAGYNSLSMHLPVPQAFLYIYIYCIFLNQLFPLLHIVAVLAH